MPGGRTDHFEFFTHSADGFTPARQIYGAPNPFRDREVAGTCYALDFPVCGILQDYLQPLSRVMSPFDSIGVSQQGGANQRAGRWGRLCFRGFGRRGRARSPRRG